MRLTRILVCWAAFTVLGTTAARGATVTWGSATTIAGDSDVSTAGTLVAAYNIGDSDIVTSAVTINGVTFDPFGVATNSSSTTHGSMTLFALAGTVTTNSGTGSANAPFSGLSANYQTLLSTAVQKDTSNGPPEVDLTFSGLTVGNAYSVQLWVNDSTANSNSAFLSGGGVALIDPNTSNAAGGVGQHVIGTFTANAATQTVGVNGFPGLINAVQLRTPVPEPATAGLVAVAAMLMLRWRCERGRN